MTGFDWAETIRNFGKHCGMTTREALDGQTFGQFLAVWYKASSNSTGLDMDYLREQINKRRVAKGLPPMKPAPKQG